VKLAETGCASPDWIDGTAPGSGVVAVKPVGDRLNELACGAEVEGEAEGDCLDGVVCEASQPGGLGQDEVEVERPLGVLLGFQEEIVPLERRGAGEAFEAGEAPAGGLVEEPGQEFAGLFLPSQE